MTPNTKRTKPTYLPEISKFKPVKNKGLPNKFGAFDCETEGLAGRPVLICMVLNNGEKRHFTGDDCAHQFVKYVSKRKFRGYHLYAHNLKFDLEKTFGEVYGNTLDTKELEVLRSDSRLIRAVHHFDGNKRVTFLDSMNLFDMKLEKLGEQVGYPKLTMSTKFSEVDKNGDPLLIKEEDITEYDKEYCYRDCEIVMEGLRVFEELIKPFPIKIKLTVASTAREIWRSMSCQESGIFVDVEKDEKFNLSYYGGRTEVFVRGLRETPKNYYDVNSLYPSVMINNFFPDPDTFKYGVELHKALEEFEGCAELTVKVPDDMNIPILPKRTEEGKIIFAGGVVRGVWNFPEIRLAIANGYKIREVHWVLSGKRISSPFEEYVNFFMDKKVMYSKEGKDGLATVCKLLLNSLYGKFAQKNRATEVLVHEEPVSGDYDYRQITPNTWILGCVPRERSPETIVCWASYVTSFSRCVLYSYLQNSNPDYCDTDSVTIEKELHPNVVDEYEIGLMKKEYEIEASNFVSPKRYAVVGWDVKNKKVVCFKKCKGVTKSVVDEIKFSDFDKNMSVFYIKPYTPLSALKSKTGIKPFSPQKVHKALSKTNDKRIFDEDGNSTPIILNDDVNLT